MKKPTPEQIVDYIAGVILGLLFLVVLVVGTKILSDWIHQ